MDHLNVGYEPRPSARFLHPPWLDRVLLKDPGAPVTPLTSLPPPNVTSRRPESALTPKQLQWSGKLPEFPLPIPTSLAQLVATWRTRFTLLNPAVTWVGGKDNLAHHIPLSFLPSYSLASLGNNWQEQEGPDGRTEEEPMPRAMVSSLPSGSPGTLPPASSPSDNDSQRLEKTSWSCVTQRSTEMVP